MKNKLILILFFSTASSCVLANELKQLEDYFSTKIVNASNVKIDSFINGFSSYMTDVVTTSGERFSRYSIFVRNLGEAKGFEHKVLIDNTDDGNNHLHMTYNSNTININQINIMDAVYFHSDAVRLISASLSEQVPKKQLLERIPPKSALYDYVKACLYDDVSFSIKANNNKALLTITSSDKFKFSATYDLNKNRAIKDYNLKSDCNMRFRDFVDLSDPLYSGFPIFDFDYKNLL